MAKKITAINVENLANLLYHYLGTQQMDFTQFTLTMTTENGGLQVSLGLSREILEKVMVVLAMKIDKDQQAAQLVQFYGRS